MRFHVIVIFFFSFFSFFFFVLVLDIYIQTAEGKLNQTKIKVHLTHRVAQICPYKCKNLEHIYITKIILRTQMQQTLVNSVFIWYVLVTKPLLGVGTGIWTTVPGRAQRRCIKNGRSQREVETKPRKQKCVGRIAKG